MIQNFIQHNSNQQDSFKPSNTKTTHIQKSKKPRIMQKDSNINQETPNPCDKSSKFQLLYQKNHESEKISRTHVKKYKKIRPNQKMYLASIELLNRWEKEKKNGLIKIKLKFVKGFKEGVAKNSEMFSCLGTKLYCMYRECLGALLYV